MTKATWCYLFLHRPQTLCRYSFQKYLWFVSIFETSVCLWEKLMEFLKSFKINYAIYWTFVCRPKWKKYAFHPTFLAQKICVNLKSKLLQLICKWQTHHAVSGCIFSYHSHALLMAITRSCNKLYMFCLIWLYLSMCLYYCHRWFSRSSFWIFLNEGIDGPVDTV